MILCEFVKTSTNDIFCIQHLCFKFLPCWSHRFKRWDRIRDAWHFRSWKNLLKCMRNMWNMWARFSVLELRLVAISLVLQNLEWASPFRECGASKGIQESVSRQRPKTSRISTRAKTVLEWWSSFTFVHPWYIFLIDATEWLVIIYVRNTQSPKIKSDGLPLQLENWRLSVPITSD